MKAQSYAIPNALAVTTAIVFVVCRVLVGIFPDASFALAQSWFHGIEFSKSSALNLDIGSFVLGIISSAAVAGVIGFIFVRVYKLFNSGSR